jgi:hypothetical protein
MRERDIAGTARRSWGRSGRSVGDPGAHGGTLPRTPYENNSGVWGGERNRRNCSSCQMDLLEMIIMCIQMYLIFSCWKCSPGRRSNDDDKYILLLLLLRLRLSSREETAAAEDKDEAAAASKQPPRKCVKEQPRRSSSRNVVNDDVCHPSASVSNVNRVPPVGLRKQWQPCATRRPP